MTGTAYTRIVDSIRRRIESGQLLVGDRVPSTRQITREWGVAMATATKVLTALRQEGLVVARPGVGTVVAEPAARAVTVEVTRERVVRAAIGIADAEGAGALSMRRIAAELGVATMSLYRHVSSKDELLVHMIDTVFGDHPFPEPVPAGWRDGLELAARQQWTIFRRHPWAVLALSLTRPTPTPNTVAHSDWVMRVLDGAGLDGYRIFQVHLTLFSFVRGIAVNLEWDAAAEQETGLSNEQYRDAQDTAFGKVVATGAYPVFVRVVETSEFDLDLDEQFEFGLRHLLDGFAATLPGLGPGLSPGAAG